MDRKNKKDQQKEVRERETSGSTPEGKPRPTLPLGTSPDGGESFASPVPIKSALSSSIQSPPTTGGSGQHQRHSSSPMREPFGPPSAGLGAPSAGFGRSPIAFSSSPSRPSPLSASFSGRTSVPGPLALKSSTAVATHSPLRPPTSAQSAIFSSSFQHTTVPLDRAAAPLSASFADGSSIKNIWARSETPAEQLSPRRPIPRQSRPSNEMVFMDDDDDDHGEDFLPASLNDLLTPAERARRLSRRDSNDSYGASPASARGGFLSAGWAATGGGHERLAQSAGANLGPANFLQSLWSNDGADKRRENGDDLAPSPTLGGPNGNATITRSSLLTQSKGADTAVGLGVSPSRDIEHHYPLRHPPHPSSPSARAFNEHAPGQSLPGGVATALSRLHLHNPKSSSGLAKDQIPGTLPSSSSREITPPLSTVPLPHSNSKKDDHDDGLFAMDG